MKRIRRLLIAVINAIILGWLLKVVLIDYTDEGIGFLFMLTFIFLGIYNCYLLAIYNLYPENKRRLIYPEIIYGVVLILPVFILWYYTS
jgi:hypothetical protein